MSREEKNKIEQEDIIDQMEEEIEEIEDEEGDIDEDKIAEAIKPEDEKSIDVLARTMADFENYKKRVERDRDDMIFFLKSDIFKKILPRLDDIDRIIKNTPEELKENALYEGLLSLQKKLIGDLEKAGVKSFDSIGSEVDPHMHDVMTTVAGKESGIIFDEFERGYKLGDKILRHAKVIVGE